MKRVVTAIVLMAAMLSVAAQEVTITAEAPESAVAGRQFRIIYTINSTGGQFTPPTFDPSFSVQGPQQSTSRNIQWINGDMKSVSTTTLIYYITPMSPGTYTIPPARFETRKVTALSRELQIVVYDEGQAAVPPGRQQGQPATAGDGSSGGSDLYLRLHLSDREVYAGQPVTATLKLYSRVNISDLQDLSYPDFRGFLREDIDTPPLRSLEREIVDGREYGTGVIQRLVLYPQIAGEITIDPVNLTVIVQERGTGRDPFFDNPFFDDPFFSGVFGSVSNVPRKISTPSAVIRVKPLPSPRPADFYGAVGSYTIESSLSSTEARVNEALTLTVTLKGSGNLSLAGEPVIHFPQGIEKYDPKVTLRSSGTSSGTKQFEYLLIPRNRGTFEIPPLSYSVFDPRQERYVTLRTGGYRVTVTGSAAGGEVDAPLFSGGEEMKYLGRDIRFIHNGDRRLAPTVRPVIVSMRYWIWYAVALLISVVVLILRREQIRRNADAARMRSRKASRNARRRLAKASSLLSTGKKEMVNAEVARALWGYLGDKLRLPPSEITRERCFSELRGRKVSEELISELDTIVTATEYSQYAPVTGAESPEAICKRATILINRLDNIL